MDLQLFIKEGNRYKVLKVPSYVVKNLLRDKLSSSELDRIHRLAAPIEVSGNFKAGSVIVDFALKKAECYQSKIDLMSIEATWDIDEQPLTLQNC